MVPNETTIETAGDTGIQAEIAFLKAKVAELQDKIDRQTCTSHCHPDPISCQLANKVTAIVGLREALTCKHPLLKSIWIFLLASGVAATVFLIWLTTCEFMTVPTATVAKLKPQSTYAYEPLILCPDGWLDSDKALSMGLSLDGLKYSLGYFNDFDIIDIDDIDKAREDFYSFYYSMNFSSLSNYLETIALDIRLEPSKNFYLNGSHDQSWYFCKGCENPLPTKRFISSGICYISMLKPAEASLVTGSTSREVALALVNHTRGITKITPRWVLSFCRNFNSFAPTCPRITIRSPYKSTVKLSTHRVSTFNTPKAPCSEDDHDEYSPADCTAKCQKDFYYNGLQCRIFWMFPGSSKKPESFCNYLEKTLPSKNQSLLEFFDSDEASEVESLIARECVQRCPRRCVRSVHEVTLEHELDMRDYGMFDTRFDSKRPNMSMVLVAVIHSGTFEGGIMTWTEIYAYSAIQLISNVGGALGLFVGGTIMTFAQLILFAIEYAMGPKRKKVENSNALPGRL